MFSGIISSLGTIASADSQGDLRLAITCDFAASLTIGESVAVNGACLTVTEIFPSPLVGEGQGGGELSTPALVDRAPPSQPSPTRGEGVFIVPLSAETLDRTAPRWEKGQKVNLERSLKMGDALDGHLVTGHVDGLATLKAINASGGSHILELEAPAPLSRFIAEKGSVTLDGVSLTVNKVENNCFWVNIIPHTWQNTTLGERKPGDALNLEIDLIARYMARLLQK